VAAFKDVKLMSMRLARELKQVVAEELKVVDASGKLVRIAAVATRTGPRFANDPR
jgi:hypothetical protein